MCIMSCRQTVAVAESVVVTKEAGEENGQSVKEKGDEEKAIAGMIFSVYNNKKNE